MIDLGTLTDCLKNAAVRVISSTASGMPVYIMDSPHPSGRPCAFIGNVGLTGETSVSLSIGFSEEALTAIYNAVFTDETDQADVFKLGDLAGEIANMVCGNAKRMLTDMGMKFDSSIPTVIIGAQSLCHPAGTITKIIHMSAGGHPMLLEINIRAV